MSEFKVPLTKILNIQPHSNAERLEIATVYGFQVITQKGKYQVGDAVIYIPVDSLLPPELEEKLFPADSKIKLHQHRIRQIRIRGLASQGMLVNPFEVLNSYYLSDLYTFVEEDFSEALNITKYEPPQPGFAQTIGKDKHRNKKMDHPLFHKYNGLDNIKWFPLLFKEGDEVIIQEKLHGTNARAAMLPYVATTFWKKVKKFFGLAPKYEFVYGSNNVDITARSSFTGFYGEDIYGNCFKRLGIEKKLKPNETVYGEIIGPSIQKNYDYGLTEHHFVIFDVKVLQPDGKQKWLSPAEVEVYAKEREIGMVPVLYKGAYNKDVAFELANGGSCYCLSQKVIEGIVVKSANEYDVDGNKKALKMLSEAYLDNKDNTDFH